NGKRFAATMVRSRRMRPLPPGQSDVTIESSPRPAEDGPAAPVMFPEDSPQPHPRTPGRPARKHLFDRHATFTLEVIDLVRPACEAEAPEAMIRRAGRDRVWFASGRRELRDGSLPALLEPDAELGLHEADVRA